MEITKLSHKNSIWTFTGRKVSLWLPYLSKIEKLKGKWAFSYNGGELEVSLEKVDFILFYGASCDLPMQLLDEMNKHRIVAILHRRGMASPYLFYSASSVDSKQDMLTRQIVVRENQIKRNYIAKTVVRERLKSFEWLIKIPSSDYIKLRALKEVKKITAVEACHTKRYWKEYSSSLGLAKEWVRRGDNPVAEALDAGSHFLYGILLRWCLFHKLSPAHGFHHMPVTYSALVYDLIEPYRYIIEKAVFEAYTDSKEENLTEKTISLIKQSLGEEVYVPSQKGSVKRKNLLHGVVLGLRAYLLGDVNSFVIPVEGIKKGGRPIKTGYRLPGLVKRK